MLQRLMSRIAIRERLHSVGSGMLGAGTEQKLRETARKKERREKLKQTSTKTVWEEKKDLGFCAERLTLEND